MTFDIYYKIAENKIVYAGLNQEAGSKKAVFDSYELAITFEDKLLRMRASNSYVTDKIIKAVVKEVVNK